MAQNFGQYTGTARGSDDKIHHSHSGVTRAVAWLALLVSVVSGVLAVSAYNRSGENLETVVSRQFDDMRQEAEIAAARAEARTRLLAIRAEVAAGQSSEETAREVAEVRQDLAEDLRDEPANIRQDWQQVDNNLQRLEQQIRNQSADALGTLESIIGDLEREIRVEDNNKSR